MEVKTKLEEKSKVNVSGLTKEGVTYIVRSLISSILQVVVFFLAAGRLNIPRAQVFFGVYTICFLAASLFMVKFNPDVVNARTPKKEDTKSWDNVLVGLYVLIGFFGTNLLMGLDVGRFQWSSMSDKYVWICYPVYLFSSILLTWSMVSNRHFESTVRIQNDRDHRVIATGPYKIVRHPGYLAIILGTIMVPFILGSAYGLITAGIVAVIMITRTALEDKTLQNELPGYSDYTKKCKYRLFPGIW